MKQYKTRTYFFLLQFIYNMMVFCAVCFAGISTVQGQTQKLLAADFLYNRVNKLYRLDQNLVNGVKYYKSLEPVLGNEFFMDEKSLPGKITVNNVTYDHIFLKYDLVNQNVILDYDYPQGGRMQIIIDNDKISKFEILDKTFIKYDFPATGKKFFQTIRTGQITCLVYYKKEMYPTESSLQYVYRYSDEKRKFYLLRDGNLYQFTGQISFMKLFPGKRDEIRKYIRRYNLQLRIISEKDLVKLLEFCNNILQNNSGG